MARFAVDLTSYTKTLIVNENSNVKPREWCQKWAIGHCWSKCVHYFTRYSIDTFTVLWNRQCWLYYARFA